MVNKSFLKQAMKNKAVEYEIAMLESQSPECQASEFQVQESQVLESHAQSSPDVEEHNAEFEAMFKNWITL